MASPEISVVVLSWNTRDLTLACLRALRADEGRHSREVIVVDNGSADGSADAIASDFPEVALVRNPDNRLYSAGNNQGARLATGRWLCLLNSDTEVRPGALDTLRDFLAAHPSYGAAGPKLLWPDGRTQPACRALPTPPSALFEATSLGRVPPGSWLQRRIRMEDFDHDHSRDVEQPPGACLMMSRQEYLEMGGLDERLSLYFNDVDLCLRLRNAGRKIRFVAEAEVIHHMGKSTGQGDRQRVNVLWWRNHHDLYRKHWGRAGAAWLRAVLFVWAGEMTARYYLGPKSAAERRAALDELRSHVRAVLAP